MKICFAVFGSDLCNQEKLQEKGPIKGPFLGLNLLF